MNRPDDLGLTLLLHGVQLIEASAGTGKTFALATLYTRLVVERGLAVPELLVVTFTEAATKELRGRLRERLALALRITEARRDAMSAPDGFVDNEEFRLTARLTDAAIEREGIVSLLQRLRRDCAAMDLAPIHTIHGFCRRALADHALEAGQALMQRALVEDERQLRGEVATDFWRLHSLETTAARTLRSLWKSPEQLADRLRDLLALDTLLPLPEAAEDEAEARLIAARRAMAAMFTAHADAARALLRQSMVDGALNRRSYADDDAVAAVWQALTLWQAAPEACDPATDKLASYAQAKLAEKTNKNKQTPASPLFAAIGNWAQARDAADRAQRLRQIAMVHRVREFARDRLAAIKHERGLIGFDDMIGDVASALSGANGDAFADRLRTQYRVALLDEFQDTDARQWAIFQRLFAGANADSASGAEDETQAATPRTDSEIARALFLIGDPKQAIYRFRGGDVYTYLDAAGTADARHALTRNFRSRPGLLRAVQALFELSGSDAFAQDGISFVPIEPGEHCADEHFLRDGRAAPALTVLQLPTTESLKVESARELAMRACVHAIHGLLADGLAGRAVVTDRHGATRAVAPGDIAVLVEKNDDAERMREALSLAGIPSAAAGRQSLYQSEEAEQLRWLLSALLAPADDERLRAALATPLFGLDARALAALDEDDDVHRHWQDRLQGWRQLAERSGVLALVSDLCADNAARLLALVDGERRLSNLLQLAEALQAEVRGDLAATLAALERLMAAADGREDDELLRLESDAAHVKILTLHKSKGLEFEFVFLPFVATGGAARPAPAPAMSFFHDGTRRVARLFPDNDGPEKIAEGGEVRAERLRLLYVGLTRARLATWLVWGDVNQAGNTPLARLLHRAPGATTPTAIDAHAVGERLSVLREKAPADIAVVDASNELPSTRLRFDDDRAVPPAAIALRVFARDWWVYSFSQLSREDDGREERGTGDEVEIDAAIVAAPSRFSGPRFGNSLHAALEHVRFETWSDWPGDAAPPGEADALVGALRDEGYVGQSDLDDGLPLLARLIRHTLNARLPEGVRLADLPASARRSEMEFHFSLRSTSLDALLSLLRAHGLLSGRERFGQRAHIEGLMTGKIDLVYEHAGRFYLLDYKSNQLPDYGAATLAAAMHDSEYTLQYLIYTLALHRWLRFRLGADYDYDRHFGGVRYLFCRGLDATRDDSPGIHAVLPPRALIDALDALLAPPALAAVS